MTKRDEIIARMRAKAPSFIFDLDGRTYRLFHYTFEVTVEVYVPPRHGARAHWRHVHNDGPLSRRLCALIPAKQAQAAGYYVREGSYVDTPDDRLGRWYIGHEQDDGFRPFGAGYASEREAWNAAYDHGREAGLI